MMDHAAPRSMALPLSAALPGIKVALSDGMTAMRASLLQWARRQDHLADVAVSRPVRADADRLAREQVAAGDAASLWMSPPPERRLPRDLNMPLSAYDPGAIARACAPLPLPRATRWTDPMALERTLDRVRALPMGR